MGAGDTIKARRVKSKRYRRQADLAERLKVSQAKVSRWETGKSHPDEFECARLARWLGGAATDYSCSDS